MATPTIIIGIGTSGMYILENVQRFYYETFKTNKPNNVEYLYLETNDLNRPVGTPIGNSIQHVYISLDNMSEMIEGIRNYCNNPQWLPNPENVLSAGLGAGGIRSCGRLALWGNNFLGNNFANVIKAITNAYQNVMHINNNDANQKGSKPTVFIVGSLTGGTGSGILIDMGYLIRHIIAGITDLYGLFLLPKEPIDMRGYEVRYGNAYGAIKDLTYFNDLANTYREKWPNGMQKKYKEPPYELVQFISQDYQDGTPAIQSLNGLFKMAGLYLFLNIAGIYEKRRERLVDGQGNSLIGKYGTFGLSAIQYPKDQIQDYVASQLSIELLERLTDYKNYFLNGNQMPINRATIKKEADRNFDKILKNVFVTLNIVGNEDLLRSIDNDAICINKKEIQDSPVDYIIKKFTSSGNDNYHALVQNNISSAQNVLIDSIYQQVDNVLKITESIYYAKHVLEDIVESIEKTLDYWRSIGLSSQSQNWDDMLRKLAISCTKNRYQSVLEQDNVLKDRLITIFELMKIHLSIRMLIDICNNIKGGNVRLRGNSCELPKLKFFDDLINRLKVVIGSIDNQDGGSLSLMRHLKDIESDINDTTLPILRVYPSNSFDEECKNAKAAYTQMSNSRIRSMSDVIQRQNIFDYFRQNNMDDNINEIYLDFLKQYRLKVEQLNCIADFNVATFIKGHVGTSTATARKAISPFLKVDRVFTPNAYLPHFVVGDDMNDINDVLTAFRGQNFNDFPDIPDGKKELLDLKNIIVFYDEKGNYLPIEDLTYIDLMIDAYERIPADLADATITDEIWRNNRNAYTTN